LSVQAKICGLTTPDTVQAALSAGAAYLGFNGFPRSPRFIEATAARPLREMARGRALSVSVLVNPDDALVAHVLEALAPDLLQLHGTETPERVAEIAAVARPLGVGLIKAFGVSTPEDIALSDVYAEVVDLFLFDAKPPPNAVMPGGHGVGYDWSILRAATPKRPWMLSGGLNPANVAAAIAASGAPCVDVASGVETAPGLKDASLIAAFMAALQT
jgi:phosphoribosylanthranilate isomerase